MPFGHSCFSVRYLTADSNRKASDYPPSARTIHLPRSPRVNGCMKIRQNPTDKDTRITDLISSVLLTSTRPLFSLDPTSPSRTLSSFQEEHNQTSRQAHPLTHPVRLQAAPQSQCPNHRQHSVDCPQTLEHKTLLKHPVGVTIVNENNRAQQRANGHHDHEELEVAQRCANRLPVLGQG
ncbi:hypothetical protein ARMGADRAFT_1033636 [Armillaria gallica]|uniref:Uncharacterized protein n=1 Tax=Armillaria gallica TaxID=47427 RepID=A0A2H3D1D2_ARMGA|nr:hypothetical protein ARMGADRAFT_1033636 [Armillaria gallica]